MLSSLLGTALGSAFGLVQNIIEKKQERQEQTEVRQIEKEQAIELAKIQAQSQNINLDIAREDVKKTELNNQIATSQATQNEYQNFADSVIKTSAYIEGNQYMLVRIANFIIGITRPLITFLLLILFSILALYNKNNVDIVEAVFITLDTTLAYWFVRRSHEKMQIQKKKS